MEVSKLKARLAELDADIKEARLKAANAQSDLELAVQKRRNFASINCDHPREQRYERSCMGREIDIYCGVCDSAL
jgi:hypothetical protein